MRQYMLGMYQPDGGPPAPEVLDKIMEDIGALNQKIREAGAWVFTFGLHDAGTATVLRPENGVVLTTDGLFTEGKEHLGGFWIIKAPDLDAALEWGRLAAFASTLPVEVRPLRDLPGD